MGEFDMSKMKLNCLKYIVTICVPLLFLLIPISDIFTYEIRTFLIVTVMAIIAVAFEFFDLALPALVLPGLWLVLGIAPKEVAFGGWTTTAIYMMTGAFIMTNALDECGLLKRIAYWCIKRCGGTFTGTLYGLVFAGYVLSWVTFCNAYIVIATLSYGICLAMGLKKGREAAIVLICGQIGALAVQPCSFEVPFNALLNVGTKTVIPDFVVPWYCMPFYNLPGILMLFICVFVITKIFKTKEIQFSGGKEYFENAYNAMGPVKKEEKKAAVLLCVILAYLVSSPIHGLPLDYGFMFLPWLAFFPGINIASRKAITSQNWSIILFLATCLGIGSVAAYIGLGGLISSMLKPMLLNLGTIGSLVLIWFFGGLSNLVLTPMAMVSTFTPMLTQIAVDLGVNPWPYLLTMIWSTDVFVLPHEAGALIVIFGFGLISMKDFIKMNLLKDAVYLVCFILLIIPWWHLIGLL